METVHVSGWNDANEALYADSWQERLGRFRSRRAFRGMSGPNNGLRTSLMRLGGSYEHLERPLLRTFQRYSPRDAVPDDSVWSWLAVAQHHGLPTRLLDWTYSPFVALHFATHDLDAYNTDGVVWAVDVAGTKAHLPEMLQRLLVEEDADVLTTAMLGHSAATLGDFDRLAASPFVAFFEPPSLDARIVNQYALCSLMSSPTACLEDWLAERPGLARRIIIPAGVKWEIRDKLDQANITERVLFPGLDGLSRWLARYYRPRRPPA